LLRLEVRNSQTPVEKPDWIRIRAHVGPEFTSMHDLVRREGLHTVCEEAGCPNIFECWEDREATFLIGGDTCTRRCDFCQIDTGRPVDLDRDEPRPRPRRVASRRVASRTARSPGSQRRDSSPHLSADLSRVSIRAVACGHFAGPSGKVNYQVQPDSGVGARSEQRSAKRSSISSWPAASY
jgi:lipoic acid synthetase